MTSYAFVRDHPLTHRGELKQAEQHGKGVNRSARGRRRDNADARCLALIRGDDDIFSEPTVVYPPEHPKADPSSAPGHGRDGVL